MGKHDYGWGDPDESPQPFTNKASVHSYIPRTSEGLDGGEGLNRHENTYYCHNAHIPYPGPYPYHFWPSAPPCGQCYHPPANEWHLRYEQPPLVAAQSYTYQPRHDPTHDDTHYRLYHELARESVPVMNGKREADGSRPWYGRTREEVIDDGWKMRKAVEKEERRKRREREEQEAAASSKEKSSKAIEPHGRPSDQYWVKHIGGGLKLYPLGTIKNNFRGEWKLDKNGWPYLVEQ